MTKKLIIVLFLLVNLILGFGLVFSAVMNEPPTINGYGLPGYNASTKETPDNLVIDNTNSIFSAIFTFIGKLIEFVSLFAVIALVISGIMFLLSGGDEEKVKKAKLWITWSLVGVILSISAWGIIGLLNTISTKV